MIESPPGFDVVVWNGALQKAHQPEPCPAEVFRYGRLCLTVVSLGDTDLWERVLANPQSAFIGLQDAGVIHNGGYELTLRYFERHRATGRVVANYWELPKPS